jgi:preprotein translocase subunit SecF
MEIFKDTNYDFLGKKWWFIGVSVILTIMGFVSIGMKGGLRYGIDFKGGALLTVKWAGQPPVEQIRSALGKRITGEITVYELNDATDKNLVVIGTELRNERELSADQRAMTDTLESTFGQPGAGKLDFNNASQQQLFNRLRDPFQRAGAALSDQQLQALVAGIADFRDTPPRSGLITNFEQLGSVQGVNSGIINVLKQETYLAPFKIRQTEMVGPKVGAELRKRAVLATLYALAGMLVYSLSLRVDLRTRRGDCGISRYGYHDWVVLPVQ